MENATKALLIAASVLIAVLIISLGMYIYSKSNNADEASSTMSKMAVMTNNEQFTLYEGIQNGGVVKKLLQTASQHNQSLYESDDTIEYCVCIRSNVDDLLAKFSNDAEILSGLNGSRDYGVRYPSNIAKVSSAISRSKRYKIWFSYNKYGDIWEIHIDDIKSN